MKWCGNIGLVKKLVLFTFFLGFSLMIPKGNLLAEDIRSEMDDLKERLKSLEQSLEKEKSAPEGLSFGFGLTGVIQGSINNEKDPSGGGDSTDLTGSMDFEVEKVFDKHGRIFVLIEAGEGNGLADRGLGTALLFGVVNGDAGDTGTRLEITEGWYENELFDGLVTFTLGKIDQTAYFDGNDVANDETTQFLASGFVNNTVVEFPDKGAGARVTISPSELFAISLGWGEADADFNDVFDNSFGIAEFDLQPSASGLHGNYRFYVWVNGSPHTDKDDPDNRIENYGMGMSIDHQISSNTTLFARIGWQRDDITENTVDFAWSAGGQSALSFFGRENDIIGIAFGQAHINDDVIAGLTDEEHLEVYYSLFVNEHLFITPDIQVIWDAHGDRDADTITVIGTRAQINF